MQMAQDEDEVLYVKYGNMGPGSGGNTNSNTNAKGGAGSGYGQQQQAQNTNTTQQPLPRAGPRRPQSALDRTQYSTQQQNQQAHLQQHQQGPRGPAATPPGAIPNTASNTTPALPQGMSTGIYSAELKALMGSAAYNRPVSAPQNHHVQAEKLNAYTDASNRMGGNKQEEHKKNTMELLEAVYTNYPKPLSRHNTNTNSNTNSNSNMNTMNTISSNINGGGGMGGRSGSAKWSNNNTTSNTSPNVPTTTHTPLSVVDRAMSIGRSSSNHAYQPSRTEQQVFANHYTNSNNNSNTQYSNNTNPHYNTSTNAQYNHSNPTAQYAPNTNSATNNSNPNLHSQPRERSRSANRASSHRAPLDSHTKQARLSEMYDEAILEKLDNAIGIRR